MAHEVPLWESTDERLLMLAKAGDSDALALLFLRMHSQLLSTIANKIGNRLGRTHSAEDVLQQTYQSAFSCFSQFNGTDLSAFQSWLARIADNQLQRAGRIVGAQKRGGAFGQMEQNSSAFREGALGLVAELSTGDATVSQFVARTEAVEAIRIAIAALPDDQQAVIRCRYFEQLSVNETAAKLERTAGSVRGLLDRARAALRTSMHNSALWLSRKD